MNFITTKVIHMPTEVFGVRTPSPTDLDNFITSLTKSLGTPIKIGPEYSKPKIKNTIVCLDDILKVEPWEADIDSDVLVLFFTALYEMKSKDIISSHDLMIFKKYPITSFFNYFGTGILAFKNREKVYSSMLDTIKQLKSYANGNRSPIAV